ncbi:Dak1 domain-containing protein [Lipomyces kononenkoae]|uniref:Dak1 domain-containing protein n=1 Tax=Lipomyces kononenkoae TaxID=34357 RepID=A0ACC3SQZ1_LIPKO
MPLDKHIVYSEDLVLTFLRGLTRSNPTLGLVESERIVYSCAENDDNVVVLSGGGSGHEPAHAGYVGRGMLDVAVVGSIFASPSAKQILEGIRCRPSRAGTLIIVKNYTGDVLHFGLASERARANGISVEVVIVGDDVAVGRTKGGLVGRRGLAGSVLVHKVAGAEAALGSSLPEVCASARAVAENIVTIGASLDHCAVPGRETNAEMSLACDEIEIGLGIHNEAGVSKISPIPSADELVGSLLHYLLSKDDKERSYVIFDESDDVVLLINNLGGMSVLEITAISQIVQSQLLHKYGISPVRVYVGSFMTSLNAPGFSITLLNATKAGGKRALDLLDAATDASGWNAHYMTSTCASKPMVLVSASERKRRASSKLKTSKVLLLTILRKGMQAVLRSEPLITRYDMIAGDGDCGETLACGANAILAALKSDVTHNIELEDVVSALDDITEIIESSMGGTSGGIYSIFVTALGQALKRLSDDSPDSSVELKKSMLGKACELALATLYKYTNARVGDRTLIDALDPFVRAFAAGESVRDATLKASAGADSTKNLVAKFGRASYVGQDGLARFEADGGIPDPGAVGLAALLDGFANGYYGV